MAITISTTGRNGMLDALTTAIGNAGKLDVYDGTVPAGPGTAISTQNKLASLTCASPFAAGSSSGVLTIGSITSAAISTSGTASFFRFTTSGGTAVIQGTVTATGGGGDMTLATTTMTAGVVLAVSSGTLTAGNA